MRHETKPTHFMCPKCGSPVLNTIDYYVDFYQCSNEENCNAIYMTEDELKNPSVGLEIFVDESELK